VKRARIVIRDLAKTFREDGREATAVQGVAFETIWQIALSTALISRGVIGIVMAFGIRRVETRLLRWRPEYRGRP